MDISVVFKDTKKHTLLPIATSSKALLHILFFMLFLMKNDIFFNNKIISHIAKFFPEYCCDYGCSNKGGGPIQPQVTQYVRHQGSDMRKVKSIKTTNQS